MRAFNWDNYWRKSSYHDIAITQGTLSVLNPTSKSPDGKLLYLHFDDMQYRADDYKALNKVKDEILGKLTEPDIMADFAYRELALLEQDYLIVCGILYSANELPDNFEYPEFYLRQAKANL